MEKLLKIQGNDSLSRDFNKGIINTNSIEYQNHINKKKKLKEKNDSFENRLNMIECDIQEIKKMFSLILNELKSDK